MKYAGFLFLSASVVLFLITLAAATVSSIAAAFGQSRLPAFIPSGTASRSRRARWRGAEDRQDGERHFLRLASVLLARARVK